MSCVFLLCVHECVCTTVHRFPLLYNCLCADVFVCIVVDGFILSIPGSTQSLLDKVRDLLPRR